MTESLYNLVASRAFASELLAQMTLAEKAGQIAQIEKNSITPEDVTEYSIGSVLSGGGGNPTPNDAANWTEMVGSYVDASHRSRLGIPLLYGTDAVHGHSNLFGATIFPHNIGLGAANDPDLVERVYRASAVETTAVGARWMFAPALSVSLDPRWGRNYESFGDDPQLVSALGVAAVRGMIGGGPGDPTSALTSIKHFVGDGGTTWGSANPVEWLDFWDGWGAGWQLDQGDTEVDEDELRAVHLHPFHASIAAGALTVMASYNSWNGDKLHGHRYLLTEVLKQEMAFEGFVVSDWLGQGQLDPDPARCIALTLEAGVDMIMVPFDYKNFVSNVESVIESGDLTLDRLDDAVQRILTVKHALGLFDGVNDGPSPLDNIGSSEHRKIAREAAAASAVLLKNEGNVLPLNSSEVLLAGSGSHNIGNQCGGWTIEWQGASGSITPGTTILDAFDLQSPRVDVTHSTSGAMPEPMRWPVGVVVVAEPPYAEGNGDSEHCLLPHEDLQAAHEVRARVEQLVLVVLSGRPVNLDAIADQCDAIVAAWLPGTEGSGVVDVLTGAQPFRGQLPRPWFDAWERGHGLTIGSAQ